MRWDWDVIASQLDKHQLWCAADADCTQKNNRKKEKEKKRCTEGTHLKTTKVLAYQPYSLWCADYPRTQCPTLTVGEVKQKVIPPVPPVQFYNLLLRKPSLYYTRHNTCNRQGTAVVITDCVVIGWA